MVQSRTLPTALVEPLCKTSEKPYAWQAIYHANRRRVQESKFAFHHISPKFEGFLVTFASAFHFPQARRAALTPSEGARGGGKDRPRTSSRRAPSARYRRAPRRGYQMAATLAEPAPQSCPAGRRFLREGTPLPPWPPAPSARPLQRPRGACHRREAPGLPLPRLPAGADKQGRRDRVPHRPPSAQVERRGRPTHLTRPWNGLS